MQYRREIDGLRAIAVLPVILFHAGFPLFSGGYVGVDVFFVISGYLITSILIAELDDGTFSIIKFYERRARRILPALFFVILCCLPFAWLWLAPEELKSFSQAIFSISIFSSNILFWRKSGYFEESAEENPLLHTWSLAVEEQFYIVFPLLLLILWRLGRRSVLYVIIFLSLVSLLLAEYGWRNHPSANFYLLPTRAWELGVGAVCAFLLFRKSVYKSSILSLLGLGLIGFSIFFFDHTTPFPSLFSLVPVIGTALIILCAERQTLTARLISNRVFVGIGLISFSAYLWHQPLLAFARIRSPVEPSAGLMLALSAFSLFLAIFTWRYVERPFRAKGAGVYFDRKKIFSLSALGTAFFLILGAYGYLENGLDNRVAPSGKAFSEINLLDRKKVNMGLSDRCEGTFTTAATCRTGSNPTVMVWGDSFAMHLVEAVTSSDSFEHQQVIQFTKSSCAPVLGIAKIDHEHTEGWARGCIDFNNQVMSWLSENESVEYVILSSPMDIIGTHTLNQQGAIHKPSTDLVLQSFNKLARLIKNAGRKLVFVSPPPTTGKDLSKCATYNLIFESKKYFNCDFKFSDVSESYLGAMELISSRAFLAPLLDLREFICEDYLCKTFVADVNIYRDSGHLSYAGSNYIGSQFDFLGMAIIIADQARNTER